MGYSPRRAFGHGKPGPSAGRRSPDKWRLGCGGRQLCSRANEVVATPARLKSPLFSVHINFVRCRTRLALSHQNHLSKIAGKPSSASVAHKKT